jgi:hypothetical protein
MNLTVGQPVVWMVYPDGRYIPVEYVARVVKIHPNRVTIRVFSPGEEKWINRAVSLRNLWPITDDTLMKVLRRLEQRVAP